MTDEKNEYEIIKASGYRLVKVAILKELKSLSKLNGYAYCSIRTLAHSLGMHERALQRNLRSLQDDLVLNVDYQVGHNGVNHYRLNWEALKTRGSSNIGVNAVFATDNGVDATDIEKTPPYVVADATKRWRSPLVDGVAHNRQWGGSQSSQGWLPVTQGVADNHTRQVIQIKNNEDHLLERTKSRSFEKEKENIDTIEAKARDWRSTYPSNRE